MTTCSTCSATLTEDECKGDECPICGGALETFEDRDIARSISIPKNWSANLDSVSGMFGSGSLASLASKPEPTGDVQDDFGGSIFSDPAKPIQAESAKPEPNAIDAKATVDALQDASPGNNDAPADSSQVAAGQGTANTDTPPDSQFPPSVPQPGSVLGGILETPEVTGSFNASVESIGENVPPSASVKLEEATRGLGSLVDSASPLTGSLSGLAGAEPTASFSRQSLFVRSRSFKPREDNDATSSEYRLLELLGEGGMGKVYKARQNSIDRNVAVKMLKSDKVDEETQREFLAEAVVTGDLEHPNIVPIYELGTNDNDALFYSMKRVVGTPWDEAVKDKTQTENLDILMKVADAVGFAHSRGVIHRDLKPENVMLGGFGEVLVMDWGLALTTEVFNESHGVEASGGMGGTPAYMAPEMIIGKPEDIRPTADIYLLGAILYEIITGRAPHTGTDARDCLLSAAKNIIVPTEKKNELVDIALRAMSDLPGDRHQTVSEFQESIRQYLSHSESVALSTRAAEDLIVAAKTADYQDYARALFGFQEALELWDANTAAQKGVGKARLKYAASAFDKGDFDLAASLLKEENPDEIELLEKVRAAQTERDARQQRLKVIRRVTTGLVAAVIIVIGGAFFWIRAEAQRAVLAEADAGRERDEAQVQKKMALKAMAAADVQRKSAVKEKTAANAARKDSEEKRALAIKAQAAAESQRKIAELAKQAEEYEAYIAQIGLAAAKIDENAFDSAIKLLQRCRVDLRNWEWGRLMHLCSQSSRTVDTTAPVDCIDVSADGKRIVTGGWDGVARIWDQNSDKPTLSLQHGGTYVYSVAFSPDGQFVATGSDDPAGYVRIWNAATGAPMQTFAGHKDAVLNVEFSSDGKQLLTSSFDKTARLWDVTTGKETRSFVGHIWWVWSAGFSPDESKIVTTSQDGTSLVWDVATGEKSAPFTGHDGPVYSAVFSPNGDTVASAGEDNRVMVWNPSKLKPRDYAKLAAGEAVEPPKFTAFDGHTAAVRDVRFSHDGAMLVSASQDNTIRVWDVASANAVKTFRGHDSWVRSCRFNPDGRSVISGSHDERVKVWSIADYEELRVLKGRVLAGHTDAIYDVGFSSDSESIVTCSRDRTARSWNLKNGIEQEVFAEGHSFLASQVRFFPNGRKLITAGVDNTVRIWDFHTGSETIRLDKTGRSAIVALSQDAQLILTGSDTNDAKLWNAQTGELQRSLSGHAFPVTAVAFSTDNRTAITGDARGRCLLWNVETGEEIHQLTSHTRRISSVAFTPDGQIALSGSGDNSVAQWDVATGKELKDRVLKHDDVVQSIALTSNGSRVITTCGDGFIRLWDTESAELIERFGEEDSGVNSIAVSPDGKQILTVDAQKNSVALWNLINDQLQEVHNSDDDVFLDMKERGGLVWSAAFAPDGNRVVTVGGNGARVWEVATGEEGMSFTPHSSVAAASYSHDGTMLITGSWDNSAKIWDAATGKAIRKLEDGHVGAVNDVCFSPDDKFILTAGSDGTIVLWKSSDGTQVRKFKGHTDAVNSAEFSPDGMQFVSGSSDKTARVWDIETGKTTGVISGHQWAVLNAEYSADGKRIVTGSDDATARIWDATTLQPTLPSPLSGHTAGITSVAFSPDGGRVMTASKDFTAKLWDANTGKEILTLTGHSREVTSVAFSPNGRYVVTGSQDGTAVVWLSVDWKHNPPVIENVQLKTRRKRIAAGIAPQREERY